jgi:hypothetical protein
MANKNSQQQVLRAVTQRVVDTFTGLGSLFTALDISNAVKQTLPDVRHREVSPLVRELFGKGAMGDYRQDTIEVMANGETPTQAFLYHLPEHPVALYDDAMRSQLAIPPVSASTGPNDDVNITVATVEARVWVGRDGRARVARQLLLNAGIAGESVQLVQEASPARLVLTASKGEVGADDAGQELEFEHPSLLHIPRGYLSVFEPGVKLVARVWSGSIEVVPE